MKVLSQCGSPADRAELAELQAAADPRVRLVEAPEGLDPFPYGMVWHPRLETDPTHTWLRGMIRAAAKDLTESSSGEEL